MFESITKFKVDRSALASPVTIAVAAAPIFITIISMSWAANLSRHLHEGVLGAPFVVWVLGLAGTGIAVSVLAMRNEFVSKTARLAIVLGFWSYLALIAGAGVIIGFFVLWAAAGGC